MVYNTLNAPILICTGAAMKQFVSYIRVSTQKQGQSGLGLEAQQQAVADYLHTYGGELVEEYSEVESGSKDDRPELHKALRACRLKGATLLIAKLDRLSRNHRFLVELQHSSVNFICCDMPDANRLTIGLMANIADYERQLISERTRAAMKAAKARGVTLGNPRLAECRNTDTSKATAARVSKSQAYKAEILEVITEIEAECGTTLTAKELAKRLNEAGYQTPRGCAWSHTQVLRVRPAA